jgi:UPF0042 nucleotide-binding protein
VENLRPQTGLDKDVKDFVFRHEVSREFVNRYENMLSFLLPHYRGEGKKYLSIAIGCTGGRHRSVAIAEEIYHSLNIAVNNVFVYHRDIKKDSGGVIR